MLNCVVHLTCEYQIDIELMFSLRVELLTVGSP